MRRDCLLASFILSCYNVSMIKWYLWYISQKCGKVEEQIELLKQKLRMIHQGEAFNGKATKTARSHGRKFQVTVKQETSRILVSYFSNPLCCFWYCAVKFLCGLYFMFSPLSRLILQAFDAGKLGLGIHAERKLFGSGSCIPQSSVYWPRCQQGLQLGLMLNQANTICWGTSSPRWHIPGNAFRIWWTKINKPCPGAALWTRGTSILFDVLGTIRIKLRGCFCGGPWSVDESMDSIQIEETAHIWRDLII